MVPHTSSIAIFGKRAVDVKSSCIAAMIFSMRRRLRQNDTPIFAKSMSDVQYIYPTSDIYI